MEKSSSKEFLTSMSIAILVWNCSSASNVQTADGSINNDASITNGADTFTSASKYKISLVLNGDGTGNILINPGAIQCANNCQNELDANATVKTIATPAADSMFLGWSITRSHGEYMRTCGLSTECTFALQENVQLTATFNKKTTKRCPNVQLVLDRHKLSQQLGTGTRLDAIKNAIEVNAKNYGDKLRLGLTVFRTMGNCDSETPVLPAYSTRELLLSTLQSVTPIPNSVFSIAVDHILGLEEFNDNTRKHYMILISSGIIAQDSRCHGGESSTKLTVETVTNAKNNTPSLPTLVLAFDEGLSESEKSDLTKVAIAGGRPSRQPEKYYRVVGPETMNVALDTVLSAIRNEVGVDCKD